MTLFREGIDADHVAEAAEREIAAWEQEGMRFVTLLDPDYPAQLLTVHQRPAFLMMKGQPGERDARTVAIVGTRKAGDDGIKVSLGLCRAPESP
jgi:DNA processing protein